MPNRPSPSAKNATGEFDRFRDFMQRLVAVPHSEIKAKLDAEKLVKEQRRTAKAAALGRAYRAKG